LSLTALDYCVFVGYLLLLFGIGVSFFRQQTTLKSYFLADQDIHWAIVGISVLAALFSGISYLGAPAESFFYDLTYVWTIVAFFIATPIATLLFLPFFRGLNLITAYEYLERRFDVRIRRIASALFLIRVTLYIATAIFAPALAISATTNISLTVSILLTGLLATIYTSIGGMKAVIWTDSIQFLVLCGGIILIILYASWNVPNGLLGAWDLAAGDNKTQFWKFDLNPAIRVTVWSGLLGGAANGLIQLVTDQISVQRYLTAKSLRDAQRALWFKLWITLPLLFMFYATGIVLYGYYRAHPSHTPLLSNASLVPALSQPQSDLGTHPLANDQILPFFVMHHLPSPLPGLLIAALYGSTLAVVSAGINSSATAALIDFRSRVESNGPSDKDQLAVARRLTFSFGALATSIALVIGKLGTLIQITNTILGVLGGPVLGVFLLGVLFKRANSVGALAGFAAGSIVGIMIGFPKTFIGIEISFLWIGFVSACATLFVGILFSLVGPPPSLEQQQYVYHRGIKYQ
jgi:SSS family transporter